MHNSAYSAEYETHYLAWPENIPRTCSSCGSPVRYAHSDNGKIIHTMEGKIHQIIHYYQCSMESCAFSSQYLNPTPRYDYCKSHFGQDVLNRVAREIFVFEQNPKQIHKRLTLDYEIDISLRTVQRMYQDLLVAKSHQIDENTKKIMSEQKQVIIAADGQDPGEGYPAIWAFMDLISNRLLGSVIVDSMPSERICEEISKLLAGYDVELAGVVSDKQNNLVKCMREYFPGVPHQYCTYHFTSHLWNHLEMYDSGLYKVLNKVIRSLYVINGNSNQLIEYEAIGKRNPGEIFKTMNDDLITMTHIRSKKFQFLKGLWLYRTLKSYSENMKKYLDVCGNSFRIEKTSRNVLHKLQTVLSQQRARFFETLFLYDAFKLIYHQIYNPLTRRVEKQTQIDDIFGTLWAVARNRQPDLSLESVKSHLPKASTKFQDLLAEWVRLWNSYLPGLFSYYMFPKWVNTNTMQERTFGIEKSKLIKRLSKKNVGFFLQTRGELYLRLVLAEPEEIEQEIISMFTNHLVKSLRKDFQKKISAKTKLWTLKSGKYTGYEKMLELYHPKWRQVSVKVKIKGT